MQTDVVRSDSSHNKDDYLFLLKEFSLQKDRLENAQNDLIQFWKKKYEDFILRNARSSESNFENKENDDTATKKIKMEESPIAPLMQPLFRQIQATLQASSFISIRNLAKKVDPDKPHCLVNVIQSLISHAEATKCQFDCRTQESSSPNGSVTLDPLSNISNPEPPNLRCSRNNNDRLNRMSENLQNIRSNVTKKTTVESSLNLRPMRIESSESDNSGNIKVATNSHDDKDPNLDRLPMPSKMINVVNDTFFQPHMSNNEEDLTTRVQKTDSMDFQHGNSKPKSSIYEEQQCNTDFKIQETPSNENDRNRKKMVLSDLTNSNCLKLGQKESSIDVKSGRSFKYKDTSIRKKEERAKLHGKACTCCTNFYQTVQKDVDGNKENTSTNMNHIQKVTRHRYLHLPPSTPPGYWDLGFTPPS